MRKGLLASKKIFVINVQMPVNLACMVIRINPNRTTQKFNNLKTIGNIIFGDWDNSEQIYIFDFFDYLILLFFDRFKFC